MGPGQALRKKHFALSGMTALEEFVGIHQRFAIPRNTVRG